MFPFIQEVSLRIKQCVGGLLFLPGLLLAQKVAGLFCYCSVNEYKISLFVRCLKTCVLEWYNDLVLIIDSSPHAFFQCRNYAALCRSVPLIFRRFKDGYQHFTFTGTFIGQNRSQSVKVYFLQYKSGNLRSGKWFFQDFASGFAVFRGIKKQIGHFTGGNFSSGTLTGFWFCNFTVYTSFQKVDLHMRFIQYVNPSAGPADPDGHGGSTDIQCLIFRKRFCNVKKQASGTDLKFQIFSVFLKFGIAALIHFDQFYMIQIDPGIAFAFCSDLIAAVEIHAFHNGDVFSAVIQYTNRSFGLHQLHDRGFGGGFFGRLCGGSAG